MTTMQIAGRLLATDTKARTITGTVLPYGEPGRTSLGRVTASKGCLTLPAAGALLGNLGHDRERPVARASEITEADDGLRVKWDVPKTPNGDTLLAEASAGFRTGMSVEIDDPVIRQGNLVGGELSWVGFVTEPAFASAQITDLMVASDHGSLVVEDEEETEEDQEEDTEDAPRGETSDQEEEPVPANAAKAPVDLNAAAGTRNGRLTAATIKSPTDLYRLLADAHSKADRRLLAALTDVVTSNIADRDVPQWVSELWSGIPYQRRIVPLVNHGDLTSMKIQGWRWVTKPVMAPYAGDKANVPSAALDTEPVEVLAKRLAGAHDVDRKYRDFGDTSFFESYYQAQGESYAKLSDNALIVDLKAAAPLVTPGTVPSGVAPELAALVDAALAIVDVGAPSFALVEKTVYRSIALTPRDKVLEFLSMSLSLTEGQLSGFSIIPVASAAVGTASATGLDRGEILVGARQAATFHELTTVPIRVEAIDLVKGGVDVGVFGYYATVVHDAQALARVDLTADV